MDAPILTPQLHQSETSAGDSYLKFQLDPTTPAVLLMEFIQEVLIIPTGRITLMPNMPECILGLLNRRNHIIWVVDLAQLFSLQPVDANAQQYHMIVLRVEEICLGLIVQEIKGATRYTQLSVQSPEENFAAIVPYIEGCIWQQQEKILVLSAKAIIDSPILYNY